MKLKPVAEIKVDLGINLNGRAQKFLTDTCAKHMDKYVPMDVGNLRGNIEKGTDYITYESVYAGYQYYGQRADGTHVVKNYTTPGTGKYWDRLMKAAEMNKIVKELQRYVDGR